MNNTFRFILILVFFSACRGDRSQRLTIATAANVQFAMQEIVQDFEKESGLLCDIIVGSSGKLTAQINEGAPYHIFISADMKYPEELYRKGKTAGQPVIYAQGKLVLWTMNPQLPPNLHILETDKVKHIAIANPKTAPYGAVAIEVFENAKLLGTIQNKLVYGESISQVNQFVGSGTADFGLTAKSVVLSPKMVGKGKWGELPDTLYTPIQQGAVVLKSEKAEQAKQFFDFLFSEKGKSILLKYGYNVE